MVGLFHLNLRQALSEEEKKEKEFTTKMSMLKVANLMGIDQLEGIDDNAGV